MFSRIITFGLSGTRGFQVTVETDINKGIPYFDIVGMGNEAVRESKKRVRAAIINQGMNFPLGRIVQNLTPADVRKQGTSFDLAMAIGIIALQTEFNFEMTEKIAVMGELSLDGSVLKVKGILPAIVAGLEKGITRFIVPCDNLEEALTAPGATVAGVKNLNEAISFFKIGGSNFDRVSLKSYNGKFDDPVNCSYDFHDIYGQKSAKRALEIAASGKHNIILAGSPGSGKTFMAKCLPGILPPLEFDEYFEALEIYSSCGLQENVIGSSVRPFRSVHQGITKSALIGGGKPLEIGEISLAHNGVLFMDELSETPRHIVESLRLPMEERKVYIANCGVREVISSDFIFVGAANPCPCGNRYEPGQKCTCSEMQIKNYTQKFAGPLMDRIDLKVAVKSVPPEHVGLCDGDYSKDIKKRVINARNIQKERFAGLPFDCNGDVENIREFSSFEISTSSKNIMESAMRKFDMSVRSYNKVIKVARTIADLEESENINDCHILESIEYRAFEKV